MQRYEYGYLWIVNMRKVNPDRPTQATGTVVAWTLVRTAAGSEVGACDDSLELLNGLGSEGWVIGQDLNYAGPPASWIIERIIAGADIPLFGGDGSTYHFMRRAIDE